MRQRVEHKVDDVLVRQGVVDMFALAAADDKILASQNPQTL